MFYMKPNNILRKKEKEDSAATISFASCCDLFFPTSASEIEIKIFDINAMINGFNKTMSILLHIQRNVYKYGCGDEMCRPNGRTHQTHNPRFYYIEQRQCFALCKTKIHFQNICLRGYDIKQK